MKTFPVVLFLCLLFSVAVSGQDGPSEFHATWKDPSRALVIDGFDKNVVDWDVLKKNAPNVGGAIFRASGPVFNRVNKTWELKAEPKYNATKAKAKGLGFLWGSFHVGTSGNPEQQARFYLDTAKPADDEVIALDLEDPSKSHYMELPGAIRFIQYIKRETGRYPVVYMTGGIHQSILTAYGKDKESVFGKTPLWYARYCNRISCYFPKNRDDEGIWPLWRTYLLWQYASEINCPSKPDATGNKCKAGLCPLNKCPLTAPIPGTKIDLDVNIYNGTVEQMRSKWPFTFKDTE